jgi:4-hydroxy-2-oxoheptanedioate aldolase
VRENTLKTIWARGEAVVNGWLSIPSAFSAEVMAHQGFDSLTVDMQHGVIDYQVAVTMLQAVSTTPVIPLARVPWNDPARLMKILDAGVYGVICPMVNTVPRPRRSWPPASTRRAATGAGAPCAPPSTRARTTGTTPTTT